MYGEKEIKNSSAHRYRPTILLMRSPPRCSHVPDIFVAFAARRRTKTGPKVLNRYKCIAHHTYNSFRAQVVVHK